MSRFTVCKTTLILLGIALDLVCQNVVVLVRGDSTLVGSYCEVASGNYGSSSDSFTAKSANLGEVWTIMSKDASDGAFFSTVTVGSGVDQAYALYYCDRSIYASGCSACVETAVQQIQDSCFTKEAIIWYANRDIFSQVQTSPYAYMYLDKNVSDTTAFSSVLETTLASVVKDAAYNTIAYSAANENITSTESLLAVAQCTPDIVGPKCNDCLSAALANMTSCCSNFVGVVVFLPSCQLFYAINYTNDNSTNSNPFATSASPHSPLPSNLTSDDKGKFKKSIGSVTRQKGNVLAGILTAVAFLFFMSLSISF